MSESRRTALDYAVAGTLAATIFATAAGSSSEFGAVSAGKDARWALLVVLCVVALARALAFRAEWRLRPWVAGLLAAFCAVTLVSATWSVIPRVTAERGVTISIAAFVAATIAGSAALSPVTARRVLDGVLAAVAAVALAGFVFWLVDPASVQAASGEYPARFQGWEQNPDTGAMLLAIGMPIALARAMAVGRLRWAIALVLLLAAFVAEIAASGSRGGLAAGFLALLVVVALVPSSGRRRAGFAAPVVASLAVAAWAMTIPSPLPVQGAVPYRTPVVSPSHPIDAETVNPLWGEIGGPWWTHTNGGIHRTLFTTSTRVRAWRGGIEQGLGRPLLGYGAEQPTFVNRYYGFNSENPENGYIGLFIQFGLIGLGLFLAVVVLCLWPAFRNVGRDGWVPAAAGAACAGVFLGMSQSYFHAVGNIAFLAFWVTLVLASVAGLRAGEVARHVSSSPGETGSRIQAPARRSSASR